MLFVLVTWCWMATEFINLVLYVFSVWLCVHIRWLDWPSCYTTLAWVRHCFPSHYPPDRANAAFKGECHPENSQLNLPRWTPCLFFFYFIFYFPFIFGLFTFILFHFVHSLLSLLRNYSFCWSLALCLSLLFSFVILVVVQPLPSPLSFCCSLCVVEFCPGCFDTSLGCVSHKEGLGGRLTVVLLLRLLL